MQLKRQLVSRHFWICKKKKRTKILYFFATTLFFIENADEPIRYQRSLLDKRKLARQEEKEREEEEDIRKASHADSLDQTKIQLEQEREVRIFTKK